MNNGNIVINEFYLFQKNKEKMKEYAQRPEIKARRKEYVKKSEVKERRKEYQQRPEVKAKKKEYAQRPEVKARRKKYDQAWYQKNKDKKREYEQRPEVKARRKEYKKIRHQLNKQEKEKQRELQSSHVSTLKLNFDLSSFNCDDMCSEQIKNIAWDVLESQLYSERQETELDKLLEEKEFEYMANEEQSLVLSSENLLSNLIYNGLCGEQVIKDVLNNLELDQLNLLDKSIEQLLLSEKIAEQNFEWNNSILFASNLDSDIYDYNSVTRLIP
ncbi:hypothetical protein [Spiroplasma ixodetis]|uniref:hypothetical protein n=1 Tax=Spiroplasma ixodetis TaxID=2141 RepID=UPI0025777F8B|nr:hypothetical protein [Spiroplasma ixodetis]WJG69575.1 hypothetical protein SIXOD_v1c04640 [Spiroplasma ixodetis Y32]